jgi:hypothetical protein
MLLAGAPFDGGMLPVTCAGHGMPRSWGRNFDQSGVAEP